VSVPLLPLLLFGLDWHPATELPAKQESKLRRAADLGYLRWQGVLDAVRNDPSWRAGVRQTHPSRRGPAQVGVTTHEALGLLGLTFRTDASIERVETGRLLTWHAQDRQKQLRGARLVEPTRPGKLPLHRGGRGPPARSVATVERLVAWLLQRQAAADLRRLKHLLETSTVSGSAPEETAT
jgi:hypothetical protein